MISTEIGLIVFACVFGGALLEMFLRVYIPNPVLSNYGPEAKKARDLIRRTIAYRLEAIWPEDRSQRARLDAPEAVFIDRGIEARILQLVRVRQCGIVLRK